MNAIKKYKYRPTTVDSYKNKFFITSLLYISAAVLECVWPYIIWQNFDQVMRWKEVPFVAWIFILIYASIVIIIPIMFFIGIRLLVLTKKMTGVYITYDQNKKRKYVNVLLIVGIIADLFFASLILSGEIKDRSFIPILCALFAGRILQLNIEAIALYFSVKNNKPSNDIINY